MGKGSFFILAIVGISALFMSGIVTSPYSSFPRSYRTKNLPTPTPVRGIPIQQTAFSTSRNSTMQIGYIPFVTVGAPTGVPTQTPSATPVPPTLAPSRASLTVSPSVTQPGNTLVLSWQNIPSSVTSGRIGSTNTANSLLALLPGVNTCENISFVGSGSCMYTLDLAQSEGTYTFAIFDQNNSPVVISNQVSIEVPLVATPTETLATLAPPTTPPPCDIDTFTPVNSGRPYDPNTDCRCQAYLIECHSVAPFETWIPGRQSGMACKQFVKQADPDYPYLGQPNPPTLSCSSIESGWCWSLPEPGVYCIGKPVIYLYPQQPTYVDVSVKTSGDIFISDPLYPDGGWKDVLAHPDGTLLYKDETYRELFYESEVEDIRQPKKGIVMDSRTLEKELDEAITQLGLIGDEKTEFLEFWVPKLQDLNSPYIFFSILEDDEKKRIDEVFISPKPDTFIEFIAYFKPLKEKENFEKLILPTTPPERIGFTAVEWGGTIDYQSN